MSAPRSAEPLLDARIRIDNLPAEGRELDVAATEEQRLAIAGELQINAVDRLAAHLAVTQFRGGLRVTGRVVAQTVQDCIITFAPVPQQIDEPFERVFLPAADRPRPSPGHTEVFVDLEGDDQPDYFDGHEVDLSEAILETVALALDPYPRAEGASLDQLNLPGDDAEVSPFAGLKSLLDPDGKG